MYDDMKYRSIGSLIDAIQQESRYLSYLGDKEEILKHTRKIHELTSILLHRL
nr:MAG TPA: hypothetical protein [Caudoviricetes sp.]